MNAPTATVATSRGATRAGWFMSGLVIAFMVLDGGIKLVPLQAVTTASAQLGLPVTDSFARGLGALGLLCTALYAVPRTAVLGAILLTGYMGGTVAMHVRVGNPLFTHALFGFYLGLLLWGGLYLRERRLRALLPLTDQW